MWTEKAIRNAFEQLRQRNAERSSLLEASRAVLEHHNFEDAARRIFDSTKALIGAAAAMTNRELPATLRERWQNKTISYTAA